VKRLIVRFSPTLLLLPNSHKYNQKRKLGWQNDVKIVTVIASVKFAPLTYIELLKIIWHAFHYLKWNIIILWSYWNYLFITMCHCIPLQEHCRIHTVLAILIFRLPMTEIQHTHPIEQTDSSVCRTVYSAWFRVPIALTMKITNFFDVMLCTEVQICAPQPLFLST